MESLLLSTSCILCFCVFLWLFARRYFREKYLCSAGKHVLVTGCSSGFGKEIAVTLDRLGFTVFATCRSVKAASEVKAICSERLQVLNLDVTCGEQIRDALKKVKGLLPAGKGLWGVVNNAGTLRWGPVEWEPLASFKAVADVNLWGLIDVTKTFLPLVKQERGRIVNMSSLSGIMAVPHFAPYSISKYGVVAFSDVLRREMKPWGVGVSVVEPGGFQTSILEPSTRLKQCNELWESLNPAMKLEYGEEHYRMRLNDHAQVRQNPWIPKDLQPVTDAVIHALSSTNPKASYIVGGVDAKVLSRVALLPSYLADKLLRIMVKGTAVEVFPGPSPNAQAQHFMKIDDDNHNNNLLNKQQSRQTAAVKKSRYSLDG